MTKNEIRTLMKNKRNQLQEILRGEYNKKIHDRLISLGQFKNCDILFTYVSFGSEADTINIIKTAFSMNKRVYVPKVEGREMNFYEIRSLEGLIRSKYGIAEPSGDSKPYVSSGDDTANKLMLLPGLAFDACGNRIGYGAGYYDRYMSRYPDEWIKIGLAYGFQIMEDLPVTDRDIRADFIVTDEKLIICC